MLTKNERTCRGKIENETQKNKRQTKTDDISQASTNQLQYDQNITKITKHNINIDVISIIAIITIIAINNLNMNVIISNIITLRLCIIITVNSIIIIIITVL